MATRTQHNPVQTDVLEGRKEVATAGTREAISSTSVPVIFVDITAETNNTGVIVSGGNGVIATVATRVGTPLNAGDTTTLWYVDLKDVYLDTTVNTDGVTYTAVAGL